MERIVICSLAKSFGNEGDRGKVNVFFEKIHDKLYPINIEEFFCHTKEVFITRNYSELEEKYKDELFELRCSPSKFEVNEGDCQYVSLPEYASPIRSKLNVSEVFNTSLPDVSEPIIFLPNLPHTKTIFLQEDNSVLGPFDYEIVSDVDERRHAVKLITAALDLQVAPGKLITNHHYAVLDKFKLEEYTHQTIISGAFVNVLINHKDFLGHMEQTIDYMTDEQVITKYGNMVAQNPNIRNFSKSMVSLIRSQATNIKEYKSNKERFHRFFDLLDLPLEWGRVRSDLMSELINSPNGSKVLESYIAENKADFFKDEREEYLLTLKEENLKIQSEIDELIKTKESVQSELRQKKDELQNSDTEEHQQAISDELKEKLEVDLELVKQEIKNYGEKLKEIKSEFSEYNSLKEVQLRKNNLEIINKEKDKDIERLSVRRDEIADELKKDNTQLVQSLLKIKNQVDVLTGANPTEKKVQVNFIVSANKAIDQYDSDARESFINDISDKLTTLGRKTDFDDLANIIITLSQSQFTLFSGLPGTGKTSLAKLIGQSMGLQSRLLNIPVARGWTSQRDVLGFFNALSQSFVPSSTGLYDLIEQMQSEDVNNGSTAIVLLDEFNLSQPEHYFSPFMEMADSESNRTIYTGDPNQPELVIPQHLRFLGTVNHDESVQALTPRMLDRAAIINFDNLVSQGSINAISSKKTFDAISECIKGEDFIKLFKASKYELPDDIASIINDITSVLHDDSPELGSQIIISYRKIKAISAYCNVASPLMISHNLAALDYAICQHILPLLNGYGEQFGERLKKLANIIPSELNKSYKKINHIISRGELNMQAYGAFL
ncbi:AAA family ATPase [Pseudoalteromonas sp. SR45-4]|uniref:AAA family ATPase n=1 Tax=Pseudoalteromonas sp. SR45-4 TaxID=2760929 RepID=UPI0015FB6606|nr:AAA family ATPase [Pseudoalteromonas sp. SR45-4]MBB1370785.1 AAA family ATPase [Pseudoalteromonas sp. SR45-4]